jgi:hypothetical protein
MKPSEYKTYQRDKLLLAKLMEFVVDLTGEKKLKPENVCAAFAAARQDATIGSNIQHTIHIIKGKISRFRKDSAKRPKTWIETIQVDTSNVTKAFDRTDIYTGGATYVSSGRPRFSLRCTFREVKRGPGHSKKTTPCYEAELRVSHAWAATVWPLYDASEKFGTDRFVLRAKLVGKLAQADFYEVMTASYTMPKSENALRGPVSVPIVNEWLAWHPETKIFAFGDSFIDAKKAYDLKARSQVRAKLVELGKR